MLAGPFAFYLLPIFVPWVPIFGFIKSVFIVFIYPMVVSISLVPKLVASEGKFTVRFGAGWVIMVVSRGGWVLIVVVEIEESQVVVVVVVVKCRGRMVPIRVIRSAGTATVIILVAICRVGEVSGAFVNFLVVTVDGFPVVGFRGWLIVAVSGFRVVGLTVEVVVVVTATVTATIIAVLIFVVSVAFIGVVLAVVFIGHVDWVMKG